jgi:hypothetical protein
VQRLPDESRNGDSRVARGLGELVDDVLRDRQPVAERDLAANGIAQLLDGNDVDHRAASQSAGAGVAAARSSMRRRRQASHKHPAPGSIAAEESNGSRVHQQGVEAAAIHSNSAPQTPQRGFAWPRLAGFIRKS